MALDPQTPSARLRLSVDTGFPLQIRVLDSGGFQRTNPNGGQKVVRRIAELSESKSLNPRSKHSTSYSGDPTSASGIVRCLSVHRPDESRSSPLVSTGRLGDDPFRSLGSPEGLSEVPLARGW
jgi:hypothetical protein